MSKKLIALSLLGALYVCLAAPSTLVQGGQRDNIVPAPYLDRPVCSPISPKPLNFFTFADQDVPVTVDVGPHNGYPCTVTVSYSDETMLKPMTAVHEMEFPAGQNTQTLLLQMNDRITGSFQANIGGVTTSGTVVPSHWD
jgi:hypothetical protein